MACLKWSSADAELLINVPKLLCALAYEGHSLVGKIFRQWNELTLDIYCGHGAYLKASK